MPAKTTQQLHDLSNPYGYSEMDWAAQLDSGLRCCPGRQCGA